MRELNILRAPLKLGYIWLFIDLIAEIMLKPDKTLVFKIPKKDGKKLHHFVTPILSIYLRFSNAIWICCDFWPGKSARVNSEVNTKLRFWQLLVHRSSSLPCSQTLPLFILSSYLHIVHKLILSNGTLTSSY